MGNVVQGLTGRDCGGVGLGIWTKMKSDSGLGGTYVNS